MLSGSKHRRRRSNSSSQSAGRKSAARAKAKAELEAKARGAASAARARAGKVAKQAKAKSRPLISRSNGNCREEAPAGAKCKLTTMRYKNGTQVIITVEKVPRPKHKKSSAGKKVKAPRVKRIPKSHRLTA